MNAVNENAFGARPGRRAKHLRTNGPRNAPARNLAKAMTMAGPGKRPERGFPLKIL